MTPGTFLRLVWPSQGLYCIAHPFKPGDAPNIHKVFTTIKEAIEYVYEQQHARDTFFAVLSLREERVWNPDKTDYKTGQKGAWSTRVHENMLAAKAVFFDLDVGPDAAKYPTQQDALAGLAAFLVTTKLPMPTLVSSGGGVHVYWHFDADVLASDWKALALHMRQLAEALGLKVDPMRTTDVSSVLRVPKTYNWKDRANPRPVETLQEGVVSPVAAFRQLISDALIATGVTPGTPAPPKAAANPLGESNIVFNDFGPSPKLEDVAASCAQVQEILRSQGDASHPFYGALDNTAWYRGMLATIKHVEDGDAWCRKLTDLHPRTNADVDAKLLQLEQYGPARCETLQQYMPWKDAPCRTCRFRNDPSVPNPLVATRRTITAPPPVIQLQAPGMVLQSALVPNPPKPYERLAAGGIAITRKDKDGNETTSLIYANDLYPLRRLVNEEAGTEQQMWHVTLPRVGAKQFTIDAETLYDAKKFCVAIANNGIYPNKADIPALQDYMVAYISQLQKSVDADNQRSHLGWADEYRQFVLPDKILMSDGRVCNSSLNKSALNAAQHIGKKGDLNEQVRLMRFYNHPAYYPNQMVILASLASILFHMTGHHGIVVNCSGEAGASKSTTLYTAASCWGDPILWPINGTNRGATANARTQRIVTNANLPTCVDEITHIPSKEAIDLVMNITQPGHRLRLLTDGSERKQAADSYKSAIMIATANSSLHNLLSTDNAAGTAGSMRVFEMRFTPQHVHTKAEADEFLRQIRLHYGHLGEIFAQFVVQRRAAVEHRLQDMVRDVDTAGKIVSAERYYSAFMACVHVTAEITQAMGLMPYDPPQLLQWALQRQLPYMRGVVHEEYRTPLAILTDYIAQIHGNIAVVDKVTTIGANTGGQHAATSSAWVRNTPHGALLGHYDLRSGVLYLLKQAFKDHCNRVGASSTRILDDLLQPRDAGRIVVDRNKRMTLGSGTEFAKGQAYCFVVDMKHPDVAGVTPVYSVPGGGQSGSPPAGNLSIVK